jgi:NAD(P)-dependent dehydrogenase (short-subunit alcohol dehydrogenase family)
MTLEGQSVLVTGANRGLGLAICRAFADAGALVSRWEGRADGDVDNPSDVARKISAASPVDVLVCNAAVPGPVGTLWNCDMWLWRDTIKVNLFGVVYLCRAVLPQMMNRQSGTIVIVSGAGGKPWAERSAYATSKAAVVRFAETMALECEPFGVRVLTFAPGPMPTALRAALTDDATDGTTAEAAARLIALVTA